MSSKNTALHRQPESRIYVSRPLDFENLAINSKVADFANKVGRAIKGMGRTRSLGSMAVTLLSAQQYSQVRNNLSARDRNKLSGRFDEFANGLEEILLKRPSTAEFAIRGLGFHGRNARSHRPGAWTTFAFNASFRGNEVLKSDLDTIKDYFSNENLPEPVLDPKKLHLSAGEVQLFRLATGKAMDVNEGPSIFIPAGVLIPVKAGLSAAHCEPIEG